jgi:hypothetical protein
MVTPQNSQFRKQGSVWRASALANQLLELGSQFGPEKICLAEITAPAPETRNLNGLPFSSLWNTVIFFFCCFSWTCGFGVFFPFQPFSLDVWCMALVFFLLAFFVDVWCMALALLFIFQLSNKHGHVNTQELFKHLEI